MGLFSRGPSPEAPPVQAGSSRPQHFLDVRDLRIHFPTDDGVVKSVDGLSFGLERGKTLGIVGESGSGKSVTSLGVLGLHKGTAARISGEIWLDGDELVGATPDAVRRLRGQKMSMIFQDPMSSLHPFYTVGAQIVEAYRVHNDVSKAAARSTPSTCSAGWASRGPRSASTTTRTSSPAACGSA